MSIELICKDVFLRHTGGEGKSFVQMYRCWDAEHFVAIRTAEAHEAAAKARAKGEPCAHAVEVITEAQYRKERQ